MWCLTSRILPHFLATPFGVSLPPEDGAEEIVVSAAEVEICAEIPRQNEEAPPGFEPGYGGFAIRCLSRLATAPHRSRTEGNRWWLVDSQPAPPYPGGLGVA